MKRLVEMHGGSVSASSAGTDQGSRFVVILPVSTQPPQTIGRSAVSVTDEPAASGVILLVSNEFLEHRLENAKLLAVLFFFCLASFLAFFLPVLLGRSSLSTFEMRVSGEFRRMRK